MPGREGRCASTHRTLRGLAFLAGERLGAVTLLPPLTYGLLRLSLSWAIALLVFSAVVRRVAPERGAGYRRMREEWG